MPHTIELLAPAGNTEALHAAVRGGADAVYLGLDSFNARRGADNFTLETLALACDWAHMRGVKIYVTLNTIVLPSEISQALEIARQAYRAGADAFIVQDIGIASEIARTLPDARLHISTQMNTHNAAGVAAAAQLGADRITLARELSLVEIEHIAGIAHQYHIETEAFAHGALCVCYSGQCFMSSLIGGRSANRGLCAQACRLPYELRNKALHKSLPSLGPHLLSPRDLCTIDMLPELIDTGIISLKIEGRMKSPEYVFAVTNIYRQMLDRVCAWRFGGSVGEAPRATEGEHRILAEAFSRGFTTAYLENKRDNAIMSYGRPNNRGVFIGRIVYAKDGRAALSAECELADGDVLEFWTNKGHFTYTLDAVCYDGDKNVLVSPKRPVGKGDRVFRVRSARAAFEDDAHEPRVPVDGRVVVRRGVPLTVEFSLAAQAAGRFEGGCTFKGVFRGDTIEAARTKPVSAEEVRAHIDRLGQTPFTLLSLDIDLDEDAGVGFSQLHRARAAALDNLAEQMLAGKRIRVLSRVSVREPMPAAHPKGLHIAVWATNPACARAAKRAGADVLYVPALHYRRGEAVVAGQRSQTVEQAGYPKQITYALPVVEHDALRGTREAALDFDVWQYVKAGKPVLVENLGALVRAHGRGAQVEVGPHLPVTNTLSLNAVAALGARRVWLSPELTLSQIAELAKNSPVELGLTVMGAQELMITEHCLLMSQGACDGNCDRCPRRKSPHYLRDRKGFEFPVVSDMYGRSHLYNAIPLDVSHSLPDLIHAGLTMLMIDASLMTVEETTNAVSRVVRARNSANSGGNALAKTSDTTSGHLFRGVQ